MRDRTIARNYAEALLELGEAHDQAQAFGDAFAALDPVLAKERVRQFLETPSIETREKEGVLRTALEGQVPERFLDFVLVVLKKRRQALLPLMREEYRTLLDESVGRIHANVTLAREADAEARELLSRRLSTLLGMQVIPHITVNPAILGGLVVRYGDRAMDGSLRRQLLTLKRQMLNATLPESAGNA